jgi:hypothetical protein
MARSKHRSHAIVPYRPRASKPIVIRQTKIVKAKRKHHRHHGGGMSLGGLFSSQRMGIVAGALAYGFLEKQAFFQSLPSLPLLGKTGTIAVAAYLLSNGGRNKLANDISIAAFAIAANQLGSQGTITGDDPSIGYVAGY